MSTRSIRALILSALGSAGLLIATLPAAAHHSIALQFDMNQHVELSGTITRMEWRNPHAWLYIDVEGDDGNVVSWAIEFGSANSLYRRGWRREDLPVGESVTVNGMPARDGSPALGAEDVTLPDGRTLFGGTSQQQRSAR